MWTLYATGAIFLFTALALAMLDIDHFKNFNDLQGHAESDAALGLVGETLLAGLGSGEWAFRYGGEEFAILMTGSSLEAAGDRLEALRLRLSMPRLNAAARLLSRITVSVGLAALAVHGESFEALLAVDDSALYESKRSGRDRLTTAVRSAA